jgi:DNA repair photolyase
MKALADAGVPVGISLAPIIPGMNDPQIPELLQRAKDAGATAAFYTLLRLPAEVLPVFTERMAAAFPDRLAKVVSQVRDVRGGKMYDSRFGERMRGHGPRWDAIVDLFRVSARRLGLDRDTDDVVRPSNTFRRPADLPLFPSA